MVPPAGDAFKHAMSANAAWAAYKVHQNPTFFDELASKQAPSILWLGCSDSRVPETTILGLQPGEAFVHRNIANIINPTDLNTISVIEYAVRYVKVKHIIVCGHTNCAGCTGTVAGLELGGVLDTWLSSLHAIRDANKTELEAIADIPDRIIRLAELSVAQGTRAVMGNKAVQEAIRERGLQVHATIYSTATGLLRDLGLGTRGPDVTTIVREVQQVQEVPREIIMGNHGVLDFSSGSANMTVR